MSDYSDNDWDDDYAYDEYYDNDGDYDHEDIDIDNYDGMDDDAEEDHYHDEDGDDDEVEYGENQSDEDDNNADQNSDDEEVTQDNYEDEEYIPRLHPYQDENEEDVIENEDDETETDSENDETESEDDETESEDEQIFDAHDLPQFQAGINTRFVTYNPRTGSRVFTSRPPQPTQQQQTITFPVVPASSSIPLSSQPQTTLPTQNIPANNDHNNNTNNDDSKNNKPDNDKTISPVSKLEKTIKNLRDKNICYVCQDTITTQCKGCNNCTALLHTECYNNLQRQMGATKCQVCNVPGALINYHNTRVPISNHETIQSLTNVLKDLKSQ